MFLQPSSIAASSTSTINYKLHSFLIDCMIVFSVFPVFTSCFHHKVAQYNIVRKVCGMQCELFLFWVYVMSMIAG